MKTRKIASLFLIIFFSSLLSSFTHLPKKAEPTPVKISVAIPCVAHHFKHLFSLLEHYSSQTTLPDEVVISLSETKKIASDEIFFLEHYSWPFSLKIIPHHERKSAGVNRNTACKHANGDVLLFQDADDLPHPQRVEIVKFLFENYEIDHLMHSWIQGDVPFTPIDIGNLDLRRYPSRQEFNYLHNGNIAVSSRVMKVCQWDNAIEADNDVQFNIRVYSQFPNTAVVICPLIQWRWALSAFGQHQKEKK